MINKAFKLSIVLLSCVLLFKFALLPLYAYLAYKEEYLKLSGECANAMDEAWFIEQTSDESLKKSAQINLLVCHKYDKTRKKMLMLGLSEHTLSYLGLISLEINQRTFDDFTKQHYFRER